MSHQLLFGDLHNHNAVGYAKGSLERSIELAREHLDFFAFTGHASWHDMPRMPNEAHMKWVNGFTAHTAHWDKTRRLIRDAADDRFTALLGYEWHSSTFGDYCMIFSEDQPRLFLPDHVDDLLDFAAAHHALAIPHHVAYKQGWRGANWAHFRADVSPVVEIFSEHGCTEHDRAPKPMLRHSNGGRSTANTVVPQLARGMRFGFVASTDDHLGYPGAYGEGIVGVWAAENTAAAIFDAVRARRTFAATGDRIELAVHLNGQPMGADVPATDTRQIDVRVEAPDAIHMIELVRNGRVIERHFPEDDAAPLRLPGRAKCRIQYGWGPWADLGMARVCDWDFTVELRGGRFSRVLGCFQSAPFGEHLRDRVRLVSPGEIHVRSNTTRDKAFAEDPTKSIVAELDAPGDAVLTVRLRSPAAMTFESRVDALVEDNRVEFTGPFTSESLILHRLVGPSEFAAEVRWTDHGRDLRAGDWYYVRVRLHNGHMAWSSPIWVG
mgnify:FL=1